jgi:O-antigen ligase
MINQVKYEEIVSMEVVTRNWRLTGFFSGAILLIVFLTYRSFSIPIFYVSWVASLILCLVYFSYILVNMKIYKALIRTFFISSLWLIFAVLITPFTTNIEHHLKFTLISAYYVLFSVLMCDFIIRSNTNLTQLFRWLLNVWVFVNTFFFIAFMLGYYEPSKTNFSGVFHDRNVFSITSLIIMFFAYGFKGSCKMLSWINVSFYLSIGLIFSMIIVSRSITGLLGIFLLLLFFMEKLSNFKKLLTFSFCIFLVVLLFNANDELRYRVDRIITASTGDVELLNRNESAYIRLHLIKEGFELGNNNIATGVGLDNARLHVKWPEKNTGSFLHNTYLDIYTSGGIAMFVLYYGVILAVLLWLYIMKGRLDTLPYKYEQMRSTAFMLLMLKLLYDVTWTTYFELGMVFSVVFSISISQYIIAALKGSLQRNGINPDVTVVN